VGAAKRLPRPAMPCPLIAIMDEKIKNRD